MRKVLFLLAFLCICFGNIHAELPYSKMLALSNEELKEKKFKYDSNKNQYKMSKTNRTNQTMNVLSAIGGATADMKPHQEDYTIIVQKGANDKISSLSILFFSDDTFHNLATWMAENDITPLETNSGKLTIARFNFEDYQVELTTEVVSVKTTTRNTFAKEKSFDESYNIYTYTIYTGIEPDSKWHTKEAQKKEKDRLKGKKEDLDDLM